MMAIHQKGYILISNPEHPFCNLNGYVPEHRLVMEYKIKKFINPAIYDVHHVNEKVDDNRIENLMLLSKREHRRLHSGWKLINNEWFKTCGCCKRFLRVVDNFYKRPNGHNEYFSICQDCLHKKRKINYKLNYLKHREIIICAVCGKKHSIQKGSKIKYCSIKCHWVERRIHK